MFYNLITTKIVFLHQIVKNALNLQVFSIRPVEILNYNMLFTRLHHTVNTFCFYNVVFQQCLYSNKSKLKIVVLFDYKTNFRHNISKNKKNRSKYKHLLR